MPHDKNGTELKEGDVVTLRCRVTNICQTEKACNTTLIPIDIPDAEEYVPHIACNTRLTEKEKIKVDLGCVCAELHKKEIEWNKNGVEDVK